MGSCPVPVCVYTLNAMGLQLVLLILGLTARELCIRCYDCHSDRETGCGDPFPKKDYLVECKKEDTTDKTFFCRKIYQNVRGNTTVIRSCAYVKDTQKGRDCYTTVSEEFDTKVCQCWDVDGCNFASRFELSAALLIISILLKYQLN